MVCRGRRVGAARFGVAGLGTLLVLVTDPGHAWADPAVPTHYRSVVTDVRLGDDAGVGDPAADHAGDPTAIDVDIIGDTFMVVRARGRQVEVPGYDGESYVRIHPDGRVEVNERSPSRWINDARYAGSDVLVPPSADATATPSWSTVADGGVYAWHDHRIHFMSPRLPRQIDPSVRQVQQVFDWQVPIVVDGTPVVVEGRLEWLPAPDGTDRAGVALGAVFVALAGAWFLRRWPPSVTAGVTLTVAAIAAFGVGLGGWWGLPPGAEGQVLAVVLPAVAVLLLMLAGVAGFVMAGAEAYRLRRFLVGVSGLPLGGWVAAHVVTLARPVIPTIWPANLVRMLVTVVAVLVAVAVVAIVRDVRRSMPG